MSKFKSGFVTGVKKEEAYQREQLRLHQKHEIQDLDVVVVEKDNMGKYLIRVFTGLIRLAASAVLLILAAIGVLALVYPAPRYELLLVAEQVLEQLRQMTGI